MTTDANASLFDVATDPSSFLTIQTLSEFSKPVNSSCTLYVQPLPLSKNTIIL